jgi:hypothetical protein
MMVESMKLPKRSSEPLTALVSSLRVATGATEAATVLELSAAITEVFMVNLLTFSDSFESVKHLET